ncbi:DNA polymerase III subunit psi [Psychromonas sp.]|uniref:DNA polymerase III subunit psi n=1 Tax=Psychromonas sp. TaxID=1884585 RepID=UPI003567F621
MKHQQAVYLQEMGITRWQVRKPELFLHAPNAGGVDLSHYSLLLIACENDFSHPLLANILTAFHFKPSDVYCCSMARFENQQGPLPDFIWSTLGKIDQPRGHKLITSPAITSLVDDAQAKKALWRQFCALNQ